MRLALHLILALLCVPLTTLHAEEINTDAGYQHLIEKNELRCGYAQWPDLIDIDPVTKKMSGVFFDYMNELGRNMNIKVDWVEVPWGEIPQALNSGKIDAHCSGAWTNPNRAKFVDNVVPIAYQYVTAFARANDKRFDGHIESADSPNVTVSVIDGESSSTIVANLFPRAKVITNQQGSDAVQMLLDVMTQKADLAFTETATFERIQQNNPGKIKQVTIDHPIQVYGTVILVKKGAVKLKNTLDTTTMQLINDGTIDRILAKHEKVKNTFLRPNVFYRQAP